MVLCYAYVLALSFPLHVWYSCSVLPEVVVFLWLKRSVLTNVGYKKRTFICREDSRKVVLMAYVRRSSLTVDRRKVCGMSVRASDMYRRRRVASVLVVVGQV